MVHPEKVVLLSLMHIMYVQCALALVHKRLIFLLILHIIVIVADVILRSLVVKHFLKVASVLLQLIFYRLPHS